ncbi:MAG: cation:proton antiporter [Methanoregula sp.]|nr:cation:proton antiporter [Methanoregula sp.]
MEILTASVSIITLSIALLYLGLRFRIPSIVSFLIIGMLVGPYGFGLITNETAIDTFGNIGIILLLFTIGLEFSFQKLLRTWRTVIIGGLVQVCLTIGAITLLSGLFHMPLNEALMFGFIVSLSSTAIVMKILQERGQVDTLQGRTLLGILIFQDLAIIPMMLIAPLLVGSSGPDLNAIPFQVTKVAIILLVIITLAYWAIPAFLFRVAREKNRELFLITLAGICIAIAWLTSEAGLSFTLGAFIAGLIIGESDYNIDALGHIIPFRDIFASIFFLSIGMLLNTATVFSNYYYVGMIVLIIISVKILTGTLASVVLGMPARVCIFTGFALCQIGEFSFVLAKTGLETTLIPDGVYQVFLAGAIITMALTPFFMNASPRVVDLLYRVAPRCFSGSAATDAEATKGSGIFDHIVIAGYGITGKSVARAAKIAGIPHMIIELDPEIIRKERSSFRPNFLFGDAVQEEVLEHAGIRKARTLVVAVSDEQAIPRIVHSARKLSPGLYILARTSHVRNAQYLLDLGADEIISEEFEAALEIFSRALRRYQMPESEITKIIGRMKRLGSALFTRGDESDTPIPDVRTLFMGLHVHTFTVEPGSPADGKSVRELELKTRFGIGDIGLRSGNMTISNVPGSTVLSAGDVVILFIPDAKAREIVHLFAGTEPLGQPGL